MVLEGWRGLYREPAGLDERATGAGTARESPDGSTRAAVCMRRIDARDAVDAIDAPLRVDGVEGRRRRAYNVVYYCEEPLLDTTALHCQRGAAVSEGTAPCPASSTFPLRAGLAWTFVAPPRAADHQKSRSPQKPGPSYNVSRAKSLRKPSINALQ